MFGLKKKPSFQVWNQPTLDRWNFCDDILAEPHTLIGGCTGSGKSVMMNDILFSISAFHPQNKQVYIIDLKMVEYVDWSIPHIKAVIEQPSQVLPLLDSIIATMYDRYAVMKANHQKVTTASDIYLIIDELSEVLKIKGASDRLDTIMRLARASKIHVIGCTQNVSRGKGGIPSELQKNFSCLFGLRCRTAIESRQIIGTGGCENLPRYGKAYKMNADGLTLVTIPMTKGEEIIQRNLAYEGYCMCRV